MTHQKSHNDRIAIKEIRERDGIGHQAATKVFAQEREKRGKEITDIMRAEGVGFAEAQRIRRTRAIAPPPDQIVSAAPDSPGRRLHKEQLREFAEKNPGPDA